MKTLNDIFLSLKINAEVVKSIYLEKKVFLQRPATYSLNFTLEDGTQVANFLIELREEEEENKFRFRVTVKWNTEINESFKQRFRYFILDKFGLDFYEFDMVAPGKYRTEFISDDLSDRKPIHIIDILQKRELGMLECQVCQSHAKFKEEDNSSGLFFCGSECQKDYYYEKIGWETEQIDQTEKRYYIKNKSQIIDQLLNLNTRNLILAERKEEIRKIESVFRYIRFKEEEEEKKYQLFLVFLELEPTEEDLLGFLKHNYINLLLFGKKWFYNFINSVIQNRFINVFAYLIKNVKIPNIFLVFRILFRQNNEMEDLMVKIIKESLGIETIPLDYILKLELHKDYYIAKLLTYNLIKEEDYILFITRRK